MPKNCRLKIAARGKKILRISESHPKKNQLYPYAKDFFLEFYLQIDIAMKNHSERTKTLLLSVKLVAFKSLHPSTFKQTKLKHRKISP